MRYPEIGWVVCFGVLGAGAAVSASQTPATQPAAEINVNSRYIIERVDIAGFGDRTLSARVMDQIRNLTGERFSQAALDDLIKQIRSELHVTRVTQTVMRGSQPDHIRVVLEAHSRTVRFEANIPHFVYQSKQGWSGGAEGAIQVGTSTVGVGMRSDGDELIERFAGVNARYENRRLGSDRVGFRFDFESYHQQWNQATLDTLGSSPDIPGIYRSRRSLNPALTLALAKPLTLYVGASFDSIETQFPAARNQSSNALVNTLRYHRRLEDSDSNKHDLDASYHLRAATTILGSDFVYARHRWNLGYTLLHGRHTALIRFAAGLITGRAPLFERYVLGNSSTLRGWNKWEIDPVGGNRMVHNTVEYRYRVFEAFYDTGSIGTRGQKAVTRHSVGVGLRKSVFSLAVAFPVRESHFEPMFMVGMNY